MLGEVLNEQIWMNILLTFFYLCRLEMKKGEEDFTEPLAEGILLDTTTQWARKRVLLHIPMD